MKRLIPLLALLLTLLVPGVGWAGVNVNTATASELESLPGIGPSKAAAIVEYRSANGAFKDLSALDAVPGIGPSTLQNIAPHVEFGEGGAAPATDQAQVTSSAPSSAETPAAPASQSGAGININAASAAQLQSLPGIGAAKAQAIVDDRNANGPFASCQDLTRVSGIGQATVANMGSDCRAE